MRRSKNDTLEHLRRRIERRLGRPVDDVIWEWMRERGKLALYEDMGEAELEEHVGDVEGEYLEYVELLYRLGQRRLRGLPLERVEGPQGVGEAEPLRGAVGARVAAYSRFVARVARGDPQVVDFRRRALKGKTLSEEEAYRFIRSPVLATVPWEFLEGFPDPLGVEGRIITWQEDGEIEVELTRPVRRRWRGRSAWALLRYPQEGREEVVRVASQSVLGELRRLASRLAERYGWQEGQAVWFLLTDRTPWVSPGSWRLVTRFSPFAVRPVVILEVEPWLPAATVMDAYRRIQRQLGVGRNVGQKASTLVSFLADHMAVRLAGEPRLEFPPWRRLMALWNESHPDQRYEDVRRFARDCQAALGRVAFKRQLLTRCLRLWGE
jgi:hypothetical protein